MRGWGLGEGLGRHQELPTTSRERREDREKRRKKEERKKENKKLKLNVILNPLYVTVPSFNPLGNYLGGLVF